jgi:hypothetical protein
MVERVLVLRAAAGNGIRITTTWDSAYATRLRPETPDIYQTFVWYNYAMRMIGYARVSTEDQADSGLGLEAQHQVIAAAAVARGWELAGVVEDAGVSGSVAPSARPGFSSVLGG